MTDSRHAEIINRQTFLDYGFHSHIPDGEFEVYHHPNLTRWDAYKTSIIMGICECLSGTNGKGLGLLNTTGQVEIPPDTGQNGLVDVEFRGRKITVLSMMISQQPVKYYSLYPSDMHSDQLNDLQD